MANAANDSRLQVVVAVVVVAAAFFGAFYVVAAVQPAVHEINGLKVTCNGDPRAVIKDVLSPSKLAVLLQVSDESEVIPGRAAAAAEAVSALAAAGRNVTVQGSIGGKYCVTADKQRVDCIPPAVVLVGGSCNCVRVAGGEITVEGTDEWMLANGVRLKQLLRWAMSG